MRKDLTPAGIIFESRQNVPIRFFLRRLVNCELKALSKLHRVAQLCVNKQYCKPRINMFESFSVMKEDVKSLKRFPCNVCLASRNT